MSITVHQILNDAKRLVNRLREHDVQADNIISQTQTLYKNVESMKEYCEDLTDQQMVNQVRTSKPLFIFNVQQENKHIRELQQENRELQLMLEEHRSVLQLIMSKYRQQISQLVRATSAEHSKENTADLQELQQKADSICEMAAMMKKSVEVDELNYIDEQEKLTQLLTENKGLRELLEISRTSGSLFYPLNTFDTEDKEVQTDT